MPVRDTVTDFDVVVVGGGAAGIVSAREAARRGVSVLLVEEGRVGGDCTFAGCVPSKALLESAAQGRSFGAAMDQVGRAVETVAAAEDDGVLEREGITVWHGRAVLRSPSQLDVEGRRVDARHVVLALGSRPTRPPIDGLSDVTALTNENVFELRQQPRNLLVLGAGPTGVELGQAFAGFDTDITIVESGDRVLQSEDPEASLVVADSLRATGVDLRLGTKVSSVETSTSGIRARLADGGMVEADELLIATGRRPPTADMGLEDAGVRLDDRGFIETDESMATSVAGIWAVGDVTGRLALTHAAGRMGFVAVRNALSPWARLRKQRFDAGVVPRVTFTTPEVASIGLSEAEAADRDGLVAYLPLDEVDRAIAADQTRGFVKLVAGPRPVLRSAGGGRVLGATIVAPRAGEMIHEVALAMRTGMFTGRLAQTVHAYPTWSAAIQHAASQFFFESGGRSATPARR